MTNQTTTTYAIAHNLIGFKASTLRVIVTRREYGNAWITTADLLDAGTQLVVSETQIEAYLGEYADLLSHKNGLVEFAG